MKLHLLFALSLLATLGSAGLGISGQIPPPYPEHNVLSALVLLVYASGLFGLGLVAIFSIRHEPARR